VLIYYMDEVRILQFIYETLTDTKFAIKITSLSKIN